MRLTSILDVRSGYLHDPGEPVAGATGADLPEVSVDIVAEADGAE